MKLISSFAFFLLLVSSAFAVDYRDDALRYGGTVVSVNRASDEITVRDSSTGRQRTLRVEPRAAGTLQEGASIDLPAPTTLNDSSASDSLSDEARPEPAAVAPEATTSTTGNS